MDTVFKSKFFSELDTRELYEIIRAREEIFLLEQGIVCRDLDRVDYAALHCFIERDGAILAYLRAYKTDKDGVAKVGRVLSITHGVGLGNSIMRFALPEIKEKLGCGSIVISAQKHAQAFYEKLGFVTTSDEYLEENVPHVAMFLENI